MGLGYGGGDRGGVSVYLWNASRPKTPKPWNTSAISSPDAPGFSADGDGAQKAVHLNYPLLNSTEMDYEIGPDAEIRVMLQNSDGSLSESLPKEIVAVRRPVFVRNSGCKQLKTTWFGRGGGDRTQHPSLQIFDESARTSLSTPADRARRRFQLLPIKRLRTLHKI